ncbi:MAG: plastocyanin/azurin family copper-binding protein [Ignavibacteriota bacterium]
MYLTIFLKRSGINHYPKSVLSILLLFIFMLLGCSKNDYSSNNTGSTPGANEVFIQGMAFSPANRTISVGTTLKWVNNDAATHTITSGVPGTPSGVFDSGNIGTNGTFSFTFSQAGTFQYYCKIHSSMTGIITVQ